jgi:D-glycero-alpha-D-manno-heptose 1-phosphate guanylyltransferase
LFEAIVLAGGLGTRLSPVVPDLPKAMAPIGGRPFIDLLLDALAAGGCNRVVVAVGYRRERIIDHLGGRYGPIDVAYSIEEKPLGTGGAIRQALASVQDGDCLVLNGDTWADIDYAGMIEARRDSGALISIAVRRVHDVSRYGAVDAAGGRVVRFREKGSAGPGLINAGVYAIERSLFEVVSAPAAAFSFEADFLIPNLHLLAPLAFEMEGAFIDIGVPADYAAAQEMGLGDGRSRWSEGPAPGNPDRRDE